MKSCIDQRNDLVRLLMTDSPHGVPPTIINEGLHQGCPGGTLFPMPINQAMTWNVSLVSAIAKAGTHQDDTASEVLTEYSRD